MPTAPGGRRYRCFDVTSKPFGDLYRRVHAHRSGTKSLLPAALADRLLGCTAFETLDELHARFSDGGREARSFVQDLVELGFLTSEEELVQQVAALAEEGQDDRSATITSVGIPTRDRPALLQRCLASFLENTRQHGRDPRFVVVDDSRGADMQAHNRAVLRTLERRYGAAIQYVDRAQRRPIAGELARCTGMPAETARFALLGEEESGETFGAARNTILALTKGECLVMVDDDTVCRLAPAPDFREGLALSSNDYVNEYWYFDSQEAALDSLAYEPLDFLALHEQVLGQPARACLSEAIEQEGPLQIDEMSPQLLDTLSMPGARVVMSSVGAAGDSGMSNETWRLFLTGDSLERLLQAGADLRLTRRLVRASRQTTLTDSPFCMGMNLGLDNRGGLPPFVPMYRSEENVFSHVVRQTIPGALRVHLPYVFQHVPAQVRPSAGSIEGMACPPSPNTVLIQLIRSMAPPVSEDRQGAMRQIGNRLRLLSDVSEGEFLAFIRGVWADVCAGYLAALERRREGVQGADASWLGYLDGQIASTRALCDGADGKPSAATMNRVIGEELGAEVQNSLELYASISGQMG